ncbi:MAG: phenylalanine--tRNA ligase subunit beta [Gammaproteobacteria bacterium]|nr:phenylalanine--tRNA ligase subunit beta [Gammaproteobacteria bacterium]HJL96227.1 phenylalanine--tRNA ligase subunit beta [SAR86 cluster bacterium]|tara:strand:+ start:182 stop:2212 length:2031 start_codon:yes stop_codon:yes gene_type:complete
MQFSRNWLKDFLDLDLSTEEICSQLTMAGIEVEGYESFNSKITGKDAILKLDITPNRGDCFSVFGVARELAVLNNLKLKDPTFKSIKDTFNEDLTIKVCPEGPRYVGRTIKNIDIKAKTLPLVAERLALSDQKLIDPVVDITNYILLELGQPLHAFDRDKLEGGIQVRNAKDGENLTLLDEQDIKLNSDCLVISDRKKSIALAGIMGGKNTCVTSNTKSIFLESAFFKPSAIRGRARRFGFQTDASIRFERGVDYEIQELAVNKASEILHETVGGEFGSIVESKLTKELPKAKKVLLDLDRANKILGTNITSTKAKKYLNGLGMSPKGPSKKVNLTSPSWRYDIEIEADLIEELARLEGYDSLPTVSLEPKFNKRLETKQNTISRSLVSQGFSEIISYSFISEQDEKVFGESKKMVEVENPISQNMRYMRSSLFPGLINTFIHNLNNGLESQKLFEIGSVFGYEKSSKPSEKLRVSGLIHGDASPNHWLDKSRKVTFYDVKGAVESTLLNFGVKTQFEPKSLRFLHPGVSSTIYNGSKKVGFLGALAPNIIGELGIKEDIFLFSIDIDNLKTKPVQKFIKFSKFPSIQRDLAFVVKKDITSHKISALIREKGGRDLNNLDLFDVYEGKGIDDNKKSIAISLTWQSSKGTLVDSDIDKVVEKIVNSVKKELDGDLRT